ncbi:MAG: Long-chain-fatty-acid--CoA ligase [Lentisphaerae bacterium ADurb.Bin082]|nr:MAG: Long-chain-fatty-acid--CoA ligase [Lentisphaerae bacterium ADurb.Bin082]
MKTIEEKIFEHGENNPLYCAIKNGTKCVTYGELARCIHASASFFRKQSWYGKGRSVVLAAEKQLEFAYAYFGAHLAGLVVLPVASDINQSRLEYILDFLKPCAIIGLNHNDVQLPFIALDTFAMLEETGDIHDFPSQDDLADILFTTGTTGAPKAVPLTFANELAAAEQINGYIGNEQEDVELLALPVSHSFGLGRLRCCLFNGQTIILMGSFANTKRLYRTIDEEKVTGFTMVPASWKYLQKMSGEKLAQYASQLKYIEFGSSYFSADDKKHMAELFPNTRVTMHYGLTEASRSCFMEFHQDADALGSVGKATPGVEVKIFDESGNEMPPLGEGEICIKGRHVTKGYLKHDNQDTFFDDFFRTGDFGYKDDNGYVYLKSRLKELINVGGKKVSPMEIDQQIQAIPGIVECACVGVPDPEGILGEVVKACIVKSPGIDVNFKQIAECLHGHIEEYKIPVVWQWVDEIPKTSNGKILRSQLR